MVKGYPVDGFVEVGDRPGGIKVLLVAGEISAQPRH